MEFYRQHKTVMSTIETPKLCSPFCRSPLPGMVLIIHESNFQLIFQCYNIDGIKLGIIMLVPLSSN